MKSAALRFEDLPIEDCNLSAFVRSAPALWDADHMQEYERLLLSPSGDQDWLLIEEGIDLAREHEIASILTTANGYLGIRASIAEGDRFSRPSIFAAGIYVAEKGLGARFAVLPHWLHVSVTGCSVSPMAAAGPERTHHPIDLSPACFPRRPACHPPIGGGNG